jgi:hypothetical protein
MGILIDDKRAMDAYAVTLGKTAKDLTEVEQAAGKLYAVLDRGDEIVAALGGSAKDAADEFEIFAAQMDNLRGSADKLARWWVSSTLKLPIKGLSWIYGRKTGETAPEDLVADPTAYLARIAQRKFEEAKALAELARSEAAAFRAMIKSAGVGRDTGLYKAGERPIWAPFDKTQAEDGGLTQSAEALDFLGTKFEYLQGVALGFGDAVSTAFHTLITDSKHAAQAFASAFLASIGRVASNMGDLMIATALGSMAIGAMAWPVALAIGFGLKAMGGMLSGLASRTAPAGMTSAYAPPSKVETQAQGGTTFIIQGDFNGDPVWIDRLAEKLRLAGRDRGVTVVWEGA